MIIECANIPFVSERAPIGDIAQFSKQRIRCCGVSGENGRLVDTFMSIKIRGDQQTFQQARSLGTRFGLVEAGPRSVRAEHNLPKSTARDHYAHRPNADKQRSEDHDTSLTT